MLVGGDRSIQRRTPQLGRGKSCLWVCKYGNTKRDVWTILENWDTSAVLGYPSWHQDSGTKEPQWLGVRSVEFGDLEKKS